jgi:hypothetical protein
MAKTERPARSGPRARPAPAALDAALLAAARGGRISCGKAFAAAAGLGLGPAAAGRAIARLGLKITGCRLGCF